MSDQTNQNKVPSNKLAYIIDGKVLDVLHTDDRLSAIMLSEPIIVDVTDFYKDKDQSFNIVNWDFDGENFIPPASAPYQYPVISNESILISIASYRDPELKDTMVSAIENAENPKRLHFSVVSQADDNEHPDFSDIENLVGGIYYYKINYKESKGACWARSMAQEQLNLSYNYFLQIDSHMKFPKSWDSNVISSYKESKKKWYRLIYTTYVYPYSYKDGKIEYFSSNTPTAVRLKKSLGEVPFEGTYKDYAGDVFGEKTNYFSGHFAFGESALFIETPYDKSLYFSGEEPTLSARFNDKDVNLIIPPKNFAYHRYDRVGRSMHWEDHQEWWKMDQSSKNRLKLFFDGEYLDGYGVSSIEKLNAWKATAID
jgi:hypothetical protein